MIVDKLNPVSARACIDDLFWPHVSTRITFIYDFMLMHHDMLFMHAYLPCFINLMLLLVLVGSRSASLSAKGRAVVEELRVY